MVEAKTPNALQSQVASPQSQAATCDPGLLPRQQLLPLLTISPGGREEMRRLLAMYCSRGRPLTGDDGESPCDDWRCATMERFDALDTVCPNEDVAVAKQKATSDVLAGACSGALDAVDRSSREECRAPFERHIDANL